jgi:elongation factor P
MLGITDLKPGIYFILDGEPYEVLEAQHSKYAQRRPVMQAKIRSLISGKVLQRNFLQNDTFEEAELEKIKTKFLYAHRDQYWFAANNDPSNRFQLNAEQIGDAMRFLKQNLEVEAIKFDEKIINIEIPIKIDYVVKDAPPGVKGDTAQGGTKTITLENGLTLQAPLFINTNDVVRVNTQTGQYVERVEKA